MSGGTLPVREYTDAKQLQRDAAALRARMFAPRPVPPSRRPAVKIIDLSPPPLALLPEAEPEPEFVAMPPDEIVAVAPTVLPATLAQREGRAELRGSDCVRIVSQVAGIAPSEITGPAQTKNIVKARQIAAWLLVNRAGKSLPEAGRILGGRDHTTALHSCRRVDAVMVPAAVMRGDAVTLAAALWAADWPDNRARR